MWPFKRVLYAVNTRVRSSKKYNEMFPQTLKQVNDGDPLTGIVVGVAADGFYKVWWDGMLSPQALHTDMFCEQGVWVCGEKLDECPKCGKLLKQKEYDFQFCGSCKSGATGVESKKDRLRGLSRLTGR